MNKIKKIMLFILIIIIVVISSIGIYCFIEDENIFVNNKDKYVMDFFESYNVNIANQYSNNNYNLYNLDTEAYFYANGKKLVFVGENNEEYEYEMEGNAKEVIFGFHCAGYVQTIVLDDNENVYMFDNGEDVDFEFVEKLLTLKEVVDNISKFKTKHDIKHLATVEMSDSPYFDTCGNTDLLYLDMEDNLRYIYDDSLYFTKDSLFKAIEYNYDEEHGLYVNKDDELVFDEENKDILKYNNKSIIYRGHFITNNDRIYVIDVNDNIFEISNKKIKKLDGKFKNMKISNNNGDTVTINITLKNGKKIKKGNVVDYYMLKRK